MPYDEGRRLGVAHLPHRPRRPQRRRALCPLHRPRLLLAPAPVVVVVVVVVVVGRAAAVGVGVGAGAGLRVALRRRRRRRLALEHLARALGAGPGRRRRVEEQKLVGDDGGGEVGVGVGAPRHRRHLPSKGEHLEAAPRRHLPQPHRAVGGGREEVLPRRRHRERAHAPLVALVRDRESLGEGAELGGLGHLGDERIRIDVEAGARLARAEVEVEAALEPLLDQRRVQRDAAERGVALRDEVERPVGGIHPLPRLPLLIREQVLGRRVVRLGVAGERELRRRQPPPRLRRVGRRLVPDEVLV